MQLHRSKQFTENDVHQHVRVEEYHWRYFLASASYLGSPSRAATRNLPPHREVKVDVFSPAISLRDFSIREESETPRERAYRLAAGISSASTVMVRFCFIVPLHSQIRHEDVRQQDTCIRPAAQAASEAWVIRSGPYASVRVTDGDGSAAEAGVVDSLLLKATETGVAHKLGINVHRAAIWSIYVHSPSVALPTGYAHRGMAQIV